MKKMRRIAALAAAASMGMTSVVSCGDKESAKNASDGGSAYFKLLQVSGAFYAGGCVGY